jgi:NADH-quinone oxidoreductase subunit K
MQGMDMTSMSLALSVILFSIGVAGVVMRRNVIILFLCIELMLNAVNLTLITFARYQPTTIPRPSGLALGEALAAGQMMVIFVMAVAAAEVAVGLGIIMAIYRLRNNVDIDEMNLLRG